MRFKSQLMFVLIVMLSVGLANAQGDEPSDEETPAMIAESNRQQYIACLLYQDILESETFNEDARDQYLAEDAANFVGSAYINAICEVYIEHYRVGNGPRLEVDRIIVDKAIEAIAEVEPAWHAALCESRGEHYRYREGACQMRVWVCTESQTSTGYEEECKYEWRNA